MTEKIWIRIGCSKHVCLWTSKINCSKKRFKNILTENQSLKKFIFYLFFKLFFRLDSSLSSLWCFCFVLVLDFEFNCRSSVCHQNSARARKHKLTNAFTTTSFIFNQFIKDKPFCASFNFSKLVITCEI